jgi:hypothetical protein
LKRLSQLVEVDWFGEVKVEAGGEAGLTFLRRSSTGQGDRFDRMLPFGFADKLDAVAIGQVQVADQDGKSHFVEAFPRIRGILCRHGLAATAVQKEAKDAAGIGVIFDEEHEHG